MTASSDDASGTTQTNDDNVPGTKPKHVEVAARAGEDTTGADAKAARTRRGQVDKNDGGLNNAKAI